MVEMASFTARLRGGTKEHKVKEARARLQRQAKAQKRIARHRFKRDLRKTKIRTSFQNLFRRLEIAEKKGRISGVERNQIMLAAHELYQTVTTKPLFSPSRLRRIMHESHGGLEVLTRQETRDFVEQWKKRLGNLDDFLKQPRLAFR